MSDLRAAPPPDSVAPTAKRDPLLDRLRLLTPAEVAEALGLDLSTVYKWADRGHIPAVVISPPGVARRTIRFKPEDIEQFREQGTDLVDRAPATRRRSRRATGAPSGHNPRR